MSFRDMVVYLAVTDYLGFPIAVAFRKDLSDEFAEKFGRLFPDWPQKSIAETMQEDAERLQQYGLSPIYLAPKAT